MDQSLNPDVPLRKQHELRFSSFAAHHQFHQFTFAFCLQAMLWFIFFTPLAARYHIENAFGLPYIGIHALCLYAGLGIFLFAYLVYYCVWSSRKSREEKLKRSESAMFWALLISIFGCAIKLLSYINAQDGGIFAFYCVGQIMVQASLSIVFTLNILNSKYANKDLYSQIDLVGAIMVGASMATITVRVAFQDSDKFFTKVASCQWKNFLVMLIQLVLTLLFGGYHLAKHFSEQHNEQSLRNQGNWERSDPQELDDPLNRRPNGKKPSLCSLVMRPQPFAILLAVWFFLYLKLPQYCSLFWFTQNQADIIVTFYVLGSLIGSQNVAVWAVSQMYKDSRYRIFQLTCLIVFVMSAICLNSTAQASEVWISSIFTFFMGASLSILIAQETIKLDLDYRLQGTTAGAVSLFGFYGAGLCALGDKTHYMNRDDSTWSLVNIGISAALVTLAVLFTTKRVQGGCKAACCGCCEGDGCCGRICNEREYSDDEDEE